MPQTKAIVSIENVVATASINQRVDLNLITKNFVDVQYHPNKFPGSVFRLKNPKTATLIFSSGKMVCAGAKSEEQARKAAQELSQEVRALRSMSAAPCEEVAKELEGIWRLRETLLEPEKQLVLDPTIDRLIEKLKRSCGESYDETFQHLLVRLEG